MISPVQERISKAAEFPEWLLRINNKGISRNISLCFSIHYSNKGICGGLWTNPHAWEVLLEQVSGGGEYINVFTHNSYIYT